MTSYPIVVGSGILNELEQFIEQKFPFHKLFFLTDENTEQHCLEAINWLDNPAIKQAEVLSVPAGEDSKCLSIVEQLVSGLLDLGAHRNSLLLNLGGGMVGDLGGFVASCYKRGIPFIQLPTSLLAMVDASVGGKTGVNVGNLKNQIGAFNFPEAVFCDTEFLATLPQRELISGYAEMLKHALIANEDLWEKLKSKNLKEVPSPELIEQSIDVKRAIVANDPFENNERKKLNFGHTIGHALETYSFGFEEPLLHGEAVALGMQIETFVSIIHGNLNREQGLEIIKLLKQKFAAFDFDKSSLEHLVDLMKTDKKNEGSGINFTYIESVGKSKTDLSLSTQEVLEAIQDFLNL